MIAAVSVAVSPRLARRFFSLAARCLSTLRFAGDASRGLVRTLSPGVWMGPGTWLLFVSLMVLWGSTAVGAQQVTPAEPAPWRVYFGGTALVSSQPEGSARVHRLIWNDIPSSYPAGMIGPALGDWAVQFGGGVLVNWTRSPSPGAHVAGPTGAGEASEEASPQRGYVGGTIMAVHQPDGYADSHYLGAPLGGTGAGFSGIVGGFITRNLSLEAEVSIGPALTAEQRFINITRYSTSYRDTLLSGFLRFHAMRFTRVAIEPVGGVTIAAGRAARTAVNYQTWFPYDPIGPPYDASVTRIRFGIGGGVDLVVPAGRSLAVTASFRLHALDRDDERYGPTELGIGPWVYQFGGGVRWRF